MTSGRSLRRGASALLLLAAGCFFSQPALAQEASVPDAPAQGSDSQVIAIIDMQLILRESSAVRSMQDQLDQLRNRFQTEIQQMEEDIRRTQQELSRQRAVLSADAYTKKRRDLEGEIATIQRNIQEERRGLDAAFGRGMNQVRLTLVEVVKEIAQARGADLVLSKANVVLVRPDLEITQTALERLNQRLPSVTLDLPTPEPVPQN